MNGSGSKRPKNSPVDCQMGYTGETVPIPSSRWLMSVVGSLGSSLECPGAMRRLSRCEVCFLLRGVVRGVSLLCVLQGVVASMRLKEVLAVIIYDFRITASQGGLGCSLRLPVCNVH